MRFRPCIDIHDGKVKQIVGGSLNDEKGAKENFVAEYDAAHFAYIYKENNLSGGHVIILNKIGTDEYMASKEQVFLALSAFRDGMSVGGGITEENATEFIEAGAYAVIVTSYVFNNGRVDMDRLERLSKKTGREHLILDLSCRKKEGRYFIVTDRWQKFTDTELSVSVMHELEQYACEFLIHAVDAEGKQSGIEQDVFGILSEYRQDRDCVPVTYAGGVHNLSDIDIINRLGAGKVDVTIGSALDLFGGNLSLREVLSHI